MITIPKITAPLISGLLFGAGLTLSGMTDPVRVRSFLDIFGAWDPTLAFVMGAAVLVMAVAWQIQKRMRTPIFAKNFSLPDRQDLDARLIIGAVIFGAGWGIAGLCPGPAIASLALAPLSVLPFVIAMLIGMWIQKMIFERTA
jgi:uncharacterized membrane protein YedE/YeeE